MFEGSPSLSLSLSLSTGQSTGQRRMLRCHYMQCLTNGSSGPAGPDIQYREFFAVLHRVCKRRTSFTAIFHRFLGARARCLKGEEKRHYRRTETVHRIGGASQHWKVKKQPTDSSSTVQ